MFNFKLHLQTSPSNFNFKLHLQPLPGNLLLRIWCICHTPKQSSRRSSHSNIAAINIPSNMSRRLDLKGLSSSLLRMLQTSVLNFSGSSVATRSKVFLWSSWSRIFFLFASTRSSFLRRSLVGMHLTAGQNPSPSPLTLLNTAWFRLGCQRHAKLLK